MKEFNIEALYFDQAEEILQKKINQHLKYYKGDKLKKLHKDIEIKNGLAFISASYERENAKHFNLKYFRIVIDISAFSNVLYYSNNVIDYNNKTVFYTIDDLKKDFKNYLNQTLNKF